jgi:ubiquinone/menaquinone biosynthesis C-methylase UbiE
VIATTTLWPREREVLTMPDIYATIAEADPATVARIGEALETRAADPAQRAMLESYLAELPFPPDAQVLEIGSGTGAITRVLAGQPDVAEVVGIDPSPALVDRARCLAESIPNVRFQVADGRALPFADGAFDGVVMHTLLCHVPVPEDILAEARRVLRPAGSLAVFDGDYATASVALGHDDPLQFCVAAAVANMVHDPWLARRLAEMVRGAGFSVASFRSHGYGPNVDPAYLLTLIDRGADFLTANRQIGQGMATALKAEARHRVDEGRFYGQIVYVSLIARRAG